MLLEDINRAAWAPSEGSERAVGTYPLLVSTSFRKPSYKKVRDQKFGAVSFQAKPRSLQQVHFDTSHSVVTMSEQEFVSLLQGLLQPDTERVKVRAYSTWLYQDMSRETLMKTVFHGTIEAKILHIARVCSSAHPYNHIAPPARTQTTRSSRGSKARIETLDQAS